MAIRFVHAAFRHGIGADRARYVVEHCLDPIYPLQSNPGESSRVLFLGPDQHGVALEVLAIELAGGLLLVIHVMRLRMKYRADYLRVVGWQERS